MPCLRMLTNLPKERIPRDFMSKLVDVLAKLVRKDPEKFVCVIENGASLSISGNMDEPAIVSTLESIGNLGPDDNKRIMKGLSEFVEKELQIKPERFFLSFYDLASHNIGKNGTTADAIN